LRARDAKTNKDRRNGGDGKAEMGKRRLSVKRALMRPKRKKETMKMEKSIKKATQSTEQEARADEIRDTLRYCTGTENYAKYAIGKIQYLITDGVITMAEK
jgi:hypothetical protein